MIDRDRLRVVFLGGGLPADARHLELAARSVELVAYCSTWLPEGASSLSGRTPKDVVVRKFQPMIRSNRGHLAFVYPGLRHALNTDHPDIVHVLSEPWGMLAVQAASWVRANPEAHLVLHGCDTLWHHGGAAKQWVRRVLLRHTLQNMDAWVAESEKALAVARQNGLPEGTIRARIHTNPRDGNLFRPPNSAQRAQARHAIGVANGSVTVGLLGRLVPEKGVRLFLDAAESLFCDGFLGQFLIAGDGPLRDEVRRRASSRLIPLGKLPHPDGVLQLFHALDVITCPSLTTPTWEDQGPRTLLEAMMCGCIPVGTPTGGIPEMLGGKGVLAGSGETRAVADAIASAAEMSSDVAQRLELSSWAHAIYSADAVANQLVELWQEIATTPPVHLNKG